MKDPKHAKLWSVSLANEFGQLAQGVGGRVTGTNTIFLIQKDQVPIDRRKDIDRNCEVLPIEYAITIAFFMLIGKVAGFCQL
jgi:hypothetical protein